MRGGQGQGRTFAIWVFCLSHKMLSQKADYVLSNVIYTLNLKVTSELQMLLEGDNEREREGGEREEASLRVFI